jgi:peptide deformylase
MAILEVLTYPNPRLKQISLPVEHIDDALRAFIADLEEALDEGPGAVGIAAPQVGRLQRIVVVDVSGRPKVEHHGRLVLVNPAITAWEGLAVGREGCLSVPDHTGNVVRAERTTVRALDGRGEPFELSASGYEARALQHELDHLDGLLFLDRLVSRHSDLFRRKVYQGRRSDNPP